jgi:hypothetical protein
MSEAVISLQYREGELENLLKVRNGFVDLIEHYSIESAVLNRSKMLGSIFDTVFFIGICNLREHMPSVKEVYLNVGESRNRSLRNLELLEEMKVLIRVHDTKDSRVKRLRLTDTFRRDFEIFVEQWVDSRKPPVETT